MNTFIDGPFSDKFTPIIIPGGKSLSLIGTEYLPEDMSNKIQFAPEGNCVGWGIPFDIRNALCVQKSSITITVEPFRANWIIFMHTSNLQPTDTDKDGIILPTSGYGHLGEIAAYYSIIYRDGSEEKIPIRRRFQVGSYSRNWGENCFEAVAHHKPFPIRAGYEQETTKWGISQTRNNPADEWPWTNWLWAWENIHHEKEITGFRFDPVKGILLISAITVGIVRTQPLRWLPRKKAVLQLPDGIAFDPNLDQNGLLKQIQIDLGQVITAAPRMQYPDDTWHLINENPLPEKRKDQILVEYAAHEEANFHLWNKTIVPVISLNEAEASNQLVAVKPANKKIHLRVVERSSNKTVAVKLHVHGEWGEYLAPVDRQRIVNPSWLEDVAADSAHSPKNDPEHNHPGTYIDGDTWLRLPLGKVYVEVTKGFEVKPVHEIIIVSENTQEITIEIESVLPWRQKGWVTADTHVHFLSPITALLEGAGEGVNVVNLLATQWGEFITNAADFDGRTTWGSKEAGGDGEYLVRVGSENRQHVLGHISLLGYQGKLITPLTTGGPDESAIGDPIEVAMIEWAQQCKSQNGLVVLPHSPNPRAEFAAGIVNHDYDAVEMKTYRFPDRGILPYALSDWYRFLNCGFFIPVVGGTDKMSAATAVGMVRTYARIPEDMPFDYDNWMKAVKRGETFVTVGPLLEFTVNGKPMGSWVHVNASGATVDVEWRIASVTMPVTSVELVANGMMIEKRSIDSRDMDGHWSVRIDRCTWLALLVRGRYPGQQEIVAAHSSPVMIQVEGSDFRSAADELTILEQIEGSLAYLDSVGPRADEITYKRMRMKIETVYQRLHHRMHQNGYFHSHTHATEHSG